MRYFKGTFLGAFFRYAIVSGDFTTTRNQKQEKIKKTFSFFSRAARPESVILISVIS